MYVDIYIYIHILCIYICVYAYAQICTCKYLFMHICICIERCTYMRIYNISKIKSTHNNSYPFVHANTHA